MMAPNERKKEMQCILVLRTALTLLATAAAHLRLLSISGD